MQQKFDYIKKIMGGGLKSYVPVIEDFGLGKTVIEPKTLGTTGLEVWISEVTDTY